MNYLYLELNLISIAFPLLFSFFPKTYFRGEWKYVFPAILLTAIPFCIWDNIFTSLGFWGFNPKYIGTIKLAHLPFEEVLFFLAIPYSCLFIYFLIRRGNPKLPIALPKILGLISFILLCIALWHLLNWYASITLLLASILIGYHAWKRHAYMPAFIIAYGYSLIPFALVNGILTGLPVVWYNNDVNLKIRIGSIPVEDFIYSLLLLLLNVTLYEAIKKWRTRII